MPDLPLLVFPTAREVVPETGRPAMRTPPHFPERGRQAARLALQIADVEAAFARYRASLTGALQGLEPEAVLVIEIAGDVEDFIRAIENTTGLEWLGEWDTQEEPDEDFYAVNKNTGARVEKPFGGRLFVSMVNQAGLNELLSIWRTWEANRVLPRGKTKWRDVFNQLRTIRRWGLAESLGESGMLERWRRELADPVNPHEVVQCQIELFYRRNEAQRRQNEAVVRQMLERMGGAQMGASLDMPSIGFHAIKATFPSASAAAVLDASDRGELEIDIELFKFSDIMYFRPTGQAIVSTDEDIGIEDLGEGPAHEMSEEPPVVAVFDGVPLLNHEALRGRLLFDDPFDLEGLYQPGERRHGTAMASLVLHGERIGGDEEILPRRIAFIPVMQPDVRARAFHQKHEHFPPEVFIEDRIELAVRRLFEERAGEPPLAPTVRVINLSIADPARPFMHTPSPWARLLDYLSWRYRVLFCVSAGNCDADVDLDLTDAQVSALADSARVTSTLQALANSLGERRLLSPAESINALTIGALNSDRFGAYAAGPRIDLMPGPGLLNPASRVGHGFRKSIKPDIYMPGGRQLYARPVGASTVYGIARVGQGPGHRVAHDSDQGQLDASLHICGTSNASALATRAAARIIEALEEVQRENEEPLRPELLSVLVKALIVHAARQDKSAFAAIETALRNPGNTHQFREIAARYLGYGTVDVERAIACTEQRATIIGCSEIGADQIHEYRLPLPEGLSETDLWRRLVITLAWYSPINIRHRYLREAKLEVNPVGKWSDGQLQLRRQDADSNQVMRGTVQHEVLEADSRIAAFHDGEAILLQVSCKADATDHLDDRIPYGLAVTLEVAEGVEVQVYQSVREAIRPRIRPR